jgi:hypothetical protein
MYKNIAFIRPLTNMFYALTRKIKSIFKLQICDKFDNMRFILPWITTTTQY